MKIFRKTVRMNQPSSRVLIILFIVAIGSTLVSLIFGGVSWGDALLNFGTEMAGAGIIYWAIDVILGTREKKDQLIADLGSEIRGVAIPAVDRLKRQGWLFDGSLKRAVLVKANLEKADLFLARLEEALLLDANLTNADLRNVSLHKANLSGANLVGADLLAADLQEVILYGANLKEAHLEAANLKNADLRGACLEGTHLHDTDLANTNLERSSLKGARFTKKTKWPKSFDPVKAGAILVDDEGNIEMGEEEEHEADDD